MAIDYYLFQSAKYNRSAKICGAKRLVKQRATKPISAVYCFLARFWIHSPANQIAAMTICYPVFLVLMATFLATCSCYSLLCGIWAPWSDDSVHYSWSRQTQHNPPHSIPPALREASFPQEGEVQDVC